MKTKEEIFYKSVEGVGTKASILKAMDEYAEQEKEGMKALMEVHWERADEYQKVIEQLQREAEHREFNLQELQQKFDALTTYVNERKSRR